jgi:hypothetical protein
MSNHVVIILIQEVFLLRINPTIVNPTSSRKFLREMR